MHKNKNTIANSNTVKVDWTAWAPSKVENSVLAGYSYNLFALWWQLHILSTCITRYISRHILSPHQWVPEHHCIIVKCSQSKINIVLTNLHHVLCIYEYRGKSLSIQLCFVSNVIVALPGNSNYRDVPVYISTSKIATIIYSW